MENKTEELIIDLIIIATVIAVVVIAVFMGFKI